MKLVRGRRFAQPVLFRIVTGGLAFTVALRHFTHPLLEAGGVFGAMLEGTIRKPFIYRVLMPTLLKAFGAIVPTQAMAAHAPRFVVEQLMLDANDPYVGFRLLYLPLAILILCWAAFGMRRLARALGLSRAASELAALALLIAIPLLMAISNRLYDMSTIALLTWGLAYLAERRWTSYLVILALATFNKETAILLPLTFVLWQWLEGRLFEKRFLQFATIQLLIYMAIEGSIRLYYRGAPGEGLENHLAYNLEHLQSMSAVVLLKLGVTAFLVLYRIRRRPPLVQASAMTLLVLLPLYLCGGLYNEYRAFYEVLPACVMLSMMTVLDLVRSMWKSQIRVSPVELKP